MLYNVNQYLITKLNILNKNTNERELFMEFRSNKAITLVALIITIIILLILAGVSLSMVLRR